MMKKHRARRRTRWLGVVHGVMYELGYKAEALALQNRAAEGWDDKNRQDTGANMMKINLACHLCLVVERRNR